MKPVVMIDEKGGMAFNHRRLTRDVVQREYLNEFLRGKVLWMSPYSKKLFLPDLPDVLVNVDPDYLRLAGENDYVLLELDPVPEEREQISEIFVFQWNRSYPSDVRFTLPEGFTLAETEEFKGSSHDRITFEVYGRS